MGTGYAQQMQNAKLEDTLINRVRQLEMSLDNLRERLEYLERDNDRIFGPRPPAPIPTSIAR